MTILAIALLASCNNSAESEGPKAKSRNDSLMDEVMEGHNAGMAKMNKVNEAKKVLQHRLDSIKALPAAAQLKAETLRQQLDTAFHHLMAADYSMDRWMDEFNMDSLKNDKEQQAKYLESEKAKISSVTSAMTSSLAEADSLLKK